MKFYLAFYKASQKYAKWDDVLINLYTRNIGFSHVEIVVKYDNNEFEMFSSSPRDGGVRKKKHKYNEEIWKYLEIDLDYNHLLKIYKLTENDEYDWLGIFGFIIPIKDRTHQWFCSEWCSNVLKTYGNDKLLLLEPSKLSPNKLYLIISDEKDNKNSIY